MAGDITINIFHFSSSIFESAKKWYFADFSVGYENSDEYLKKPYSFYQLFGNAQANNRGVGSVSTATTINCLPLTS